MDLINYLSSFFSEKKDEIHTLFYYFFGDSILATVVFALSVFYILTSEKDNKIKDLFGWYVLAILAIIWNPVIVHVLEKFVNFSSMYRFYYMIPMYFVIAYVFTKIVQKLSKTWQKLLSILVVYLVVITCGTSTYNGYLEKTNNFYKLSDDSIFVADSIYNDKKYKDYKKAIVPYWISAQVQQVHSNIDLVYTRVIRNVQRDNGKPSPTDIDSPDGIEVIERFTKGDTEYIAKICEEQDVNYIAIYTDTELTIPLEKIGFECFAENDKIKVYRKISFNKD